MDKQLRLILAERKISQNKLSQLTGIPASTISLFVTGARKPSFDNLKKLCEALGVSADYLLGINEKIEATEKYNREQSIKSLEKCIKKLKGS
jgi:transcriptional regulator with XRE-family HTH domain